MNILRVKNHLTFYIRTGPRHFKASQLVQQMSKWVVENQKNNT